MPSPGTQYQMILISYSGTYCAGCSQYITATSKSGSSPVVPNAPTNLVIVPNSTNPTTALDLSWDPPSSGPTPDHYKILSSTSGLSGTYTLKYTNNGSPYTFADSALSANTQYWYEITSSITNTSPAPGDGGSIFGTAYTADIVTAPGSVSVSLNNSNQLVVGWSASTTSDSFAILYDIHRRSGSTWSVVSSGYSYLSYLDNSVAPDTNYSYYIVGYYMYGSTKVSSSNSSTVSSYILGAPTSVSATTGQNSSVPLSWSSPAHLGINNTVTGYNVYRSTTSGSGYSKIASNVNSYTDNSVSNGTTYYYEIRAIGSLSGEGPASAEVSATPTAPAGPAGPMLSYAGTVSIDGYEGYRGWFIFSLTGGTGHTWNRGDLFYSATHDGTYSIVCVLNQLESGAAGNGRYYLNGNNMSEGGYCQLKGTDDGGITHTDGPIVQVVRSIH
jgi:fibronectin type 3 domain-containing protein